MRADVLIEIGKQYGVELVQAIVNALTSSIVDANGQRVSLSWVVQQIEFDAESRRPQPTPAPPVKPEDVLTMQDAPEVE